MKEITAPSNKSIPFIRPVRDVAQSDKYPADYYHMYIVQIVHRKQVESAINSP